MIIMSGNLLILLCVSSIWASSPKPEKNLEPRIINGNQAVLGQFPWQVAIIVQQSSTHGVFCGGAIINEEWILTAGQCLVNGRSATVTVGSVLIPNSANQYSSAELVLHEGYNPDSFANNIGLIRLSQRLTFNNNVKPIALAFNILEAEVNMTVSGWGRTHEGNSDLSTNLNYMTIKTITNNECNQAYQGAITDSSMVCGEYVGNTVQSPCNGDIGSPAVTDASSSPVHVAIFTYTNPKCESGFPAAFIRTSFHLGWIRSKLGVNSADLTKFSWVPSLVTVIVITTIIIHN